MLQKNTFSVQGRKINMRHVTSKVSTLGISSGPKCWKCPLSIITISRENKWPPNSARVIAKNFHGKFRDHPLSLKWPISSAHDRFISRYNFNHNFWVRIRVHIRFPVQVRIPVRVRVRISVRIQLIWEQLFMGMMIWFLIVLGLSLSNSEPILQ